ncbi:hypothetical protein ASPCADRAFT_211742 [Aspergillus carbonarius ITEM 5010]|uniref:Uncharacterized protein n=1 Tax=Aspergillus carbonarius (strain ITEM 5010) TaxID=602072 RepID=A0A1R3R8G3_ASPC5|nr:hypothetical protein ASPCADRAFT_211742 [Aspergillus carbonarius ITEM 5010]
MATVARTRNVTLQDSDTCMHGQRVAPAKWWTDCRPGRRMVAEEGRLAQEVKLENYGVISMGEKLPGT